ncbi:unnamed protein product [Prunus armeniaca]
MFVHLKRLWFLSIRIRSDIFFFPASPSPSSLCLDLSLRLSVFLPNKQRILHTSIALRSRLDCKTPAQNLLEPPRAA